MAVNKSKAMITDNVKLAVDDLRVSVEDNAILKGVDLTVRGGEIHALMGPNGSGKSTLAYVLMGHPGYTVDKGSISLKGEDILKIPADGRARKGLFLAFQYPSEVPGVTVDNFLRTAYNTVKNTKLSVWEFRKRLKEKMAELDIDESFAERYVNDSFSGGEKKRHEILQMLVLEPEMVVLDETDSGLDIDALQIVAAGVNSLANEHVGIFVITHYHRILKYIKPHFVHVLIDGRIVRSGGPELADELEEKGYEWLKSESGHAKKGADNG